MKKVFYFLFAVLALTFASCNEPSPKPNPEPDPVTPTGGFVSILNLDEQGLLKSFPYPYNDFASKSCINDLKKWEEAHGSKLVLEKVPSDTKEMILAFNTQDESKLTLSRKYFVREQGKGSLYIVAYDVKGSLIFEDDKKTINDRMEKLLKDEGFVFMSVMDTKELAYENPTKGIMMTIGYNLGNDYADITMVASAQHKPAAQPFHPTLKDFPFLGKKLGEEGIVDAIKKYENSLGLRTLTAQSNEILEYTANDKSKTNFASVRYQLKDIQEPGKKLQTANIFVTSLSLNGNDFTKEEVQTWLKLNGATNIKKLDDGIYSFDTEKYLCMMLYVADLGTANILFNPKPETKPINKEWRLMMPILDFGGKFDKGSKIYTEEEKRGNSCILHQDEWGNSLEARLPYDAANPKSGVSAIWYYEPYGGEKNVLDEVILTFDLEFKGNGESPEVKSFLEENGFKFTGTNDKNGDKYWNFENTKDGIIAYAKKGPMGFEIGFYKAESESSSARIKHLRQLVEKKRLQARKARQ